MSIASKIEWTDSSWNPITGCSPISEGCDNCYAKRMALRLAGRCGYPKDYPFAVTFHERHMEDPLHWKKPRKIFVCSMGDLFHPEVPCDWIWWIFGTMLECPQHTFMVLTKRPGRAEKILREMCLASGRRLPENCWLGVTAENQRNADERIPTLLDIPAAVRFVSVEPMLGPVDLSDYLSIPCRSCNHSGNIIIAMNDNGRCCVCDGKRFVRPLHWVICGGETGPRKRTCEPGWVNDLSQQCKRVNVPYFGKKFGFECDPKAAWMRREFPRSL